MVVLILKNHGSSYLQQYSSRTNYVKIKRCGVENSSNIENRLVDFLMKFQGIQVESLIIATGYDSLGSRPCYYFRDE